MEARAYFEIHGRISGIETLAEGRAVRQLDVLRRAYGGGNWRKRKGVATVVLADGRLRRAEIHWFEAHGVGRRRFKIKRFLDG
jgi:hypothetical protein